MIKEYVEISRGLMSGSTTILCTRIQVIHSDDDHTWNRLVVSTAWETVSSYIRI